MVFPENVKTIFEQMVQGRNNIDLYLNELTMLVKSGQLLSVENSNSLIDAMKIVLNLQDECLAILSPIKNQPSTIMEITSLINELERSHSLATRLEAAKESIRLFNLLKCKNEEIAEDFIVQQDRVRKFLQEFDGEELINTTEIYSIVVSLVREPNELEDKQETYRRITREISYGTREALANKWLFWPDDLTKSIADELLQSKQNNHLNSSKIIVNDLKFDTTNLSSIPQGICMDFSQAKYTVQEKRINKNYFSAKQFEGDIRNMGVSPIIPAFLMGYTCHFGMISLQLLKKSEPKWWNDQIEATNEQYQLVLQKLVQKGYFAEYHITIDEDSDIYYALTEYGTGAFRKETSRKLIQSSFKLKFRMSEDLIRLESDIVITTITRLKFLDQVFDNLEKAVEEISITSTSATPFPHRIIKSQQGKTVVFIPGILELLYYEQDLARISETLVQSNSPIALIAVSSEASGQFLASKFSRRDFLVYYIFIDEELLFIGDSEGNDVLTFLFQLKSFALNEETQKSKNEQKALEFNIEDEASNESIERKDVKEVQIFPSIDNIIFQENNRILVLETNETTTELDERIQEGIHSIISETKIDEPEPPQPIKPEVLLQVINTSLTMFTENKKAEAMLLLHSVADYSEDIDVLRRKASFVLEDPLKSNEDWFSLVDTAASLPFNEGEGSLNDYLNTAMWLRIFFDPDNVNDHRLNNRWRQINDDLSSQVLKNHPAIKQLISYFWNFIDRHHVGIKYCTSGAVTRQIEVVNAQEQCKLQNEQIVQTVFQRNIRSEINHAKIHTMVTELYGNNGVLTYKLQNAFSIPLDELRTFAQQFTDTDLDVDFELLNLRAHDVRLEAFLDQYWQDMSFKSVTMKNDTLTGRLRNRMRSRLREAVEPLLQSYICRCQSEVKQAATNISPEIVNKTCDKVMELLNNALDKLEDPTSLEERAGTSCLQMLICQLRDFFSDGTEEQASPFYESLLLTGLIELDMKYLPVLHEPWLKDLPPIEGYRMWERILCHCSQERNNWESAAERYLRFYNIGMYDLVVKRHADQLPLHLHSNDSKVEETRKKKNMQFTKYKEEFMTAVESAQNYGQMASKDELYAYIRLSEAAEKHAQTTENAGFYKLLLDECMHQIHRDANSRMEAMQNRLEKLRQDILSDPDRDEADSDDDVLRQWPIIGKIERMLQKRNMTVAEDYVQLATNGQKDTPSIDYYDRDIHALFLEKYQTLYNMCNIHKRDDLYRIYEQSVRKWLFPNQTNRNTISADKFIRSWYKTQQQKLEDFMEQLLFVKINKIEKQLGRDNNEYYVFPAARDAKLGQYPHPFEAFGTRAVKKGLRVLMMAGTRTAKNILDEIAQKGANDGSATIVILDYALALAQRQAFAKEIKLRAIPDIIVVIDRVMALFLAAYNQIERGHAFLMTALPSSKIQPYIPEGVIPSEMFIGRTEELAKIQNPNGPVFVYGGRQLGKTALLREIKHRDHDPDNGKYAIFIDLKKRSVEQTLQRINEELSGNMLLDQYYETWEELISALRKRLANQERPIRKLMLLLDEADSFISDCETVDYRPLEMLKELKDAYNDQFKFVLAGLRDVVRFNKQRLSENSVLAHLGHITIRPLKYLDARDLLLRPLQYLGFRIAANGEDIVSLILAKTNYYPGLIHFYCQKLIEAIAESYRNSNYNEAHCPPYVLDEKHIKTLLGQSEFLAEIDEKFQITLQLDSDNLYDILANVLAVHYYENGIGKGAAVIEFMNICKEFSIEKINQMSIQNVTALLDEMEELNIFSKETPDTDQYVFNRFSFFQMLGNEEQVWNHLFEYGEVGAD
ncbi:ATP-binding protein [Paenibacillus campi]|uniref:ATP-binding protein n=1 Tax=Paenibacillus campi TaxID=3106031 RepID=UPI002AFFF6CB|nr:ATP-binding protein [Paenibacillus sp. SGZ-1009]